MEGRVAPPRTPDALIVRPPRIPGREQFKLDRTVRRPEKSEAPSVLIKSEYSRRATSDASPTLVRDHAQRPHQVLLGVTEAAKPTPCQVIEATQRPALILAPNKTLAANSMRVQELLPRQRGEYFSVITTTTA